MAGRLASILTSRQDCVIIVQSTQMHHSHSSSRKGRRSQKMEKAIGAYEARRKFGQLIEEAFYKHDHFVIERSGRAMAVIVPVDEYEKWKRLAKERVFGMIEEVWEQNREVPSAELEKGVKEAIR